MHLPKPVVDYRKLRLSNITSPEFRHLLLLWGWVGYFVLYFLTESLIVESACASIHIFLDDLIPFCEIFVIPYVLWYFLILWSLLYFAFYDVESFRALMRYTIVIQFVSMAVYILFPNRQDLRPEVFPRDNIFVDIVRSIYAVDTNTNVCPSVHVALSVGIASVWCKRKATRIPAKAFILCWVVLICLSTTLIKQHSALDGIVAIPVCLLAERICFHKHKKN